MKGQNIMGKEDFKARLLEGLYQCLERVEIEECNNEWIVNALVNTENAEPFNISIGLKIPEQFNRSELDWYGKAVLSACCLDGFEWFM
jgi:hypothetical protein